MIKEKINLNSISEAIEAVKNGEVIIVVDDANRGKTKEILLLLQEKIVQN